MSRRARGTLTCFVLSAVAFAFAACDVGQGQTQSDEQTGEPRPVEAEQDNSEVVQRLQQGALIVLRIRGEDVEIEQVEIRAFPLPPEREFQPGHIRVVGLSGDSEVASVVVPDELLNVQEGTGLVRNEERTIAVALPLNQAIDRVTVQLRPDSTPRELDVSQVFREYCAQRPDDRLCRG